MKYMLLTLIFLHGTIHLFGFAKAFNLTQIDLTEVHISRFRGIFWFVAFLLFSFTGEMYISDNAYWHWAAIAATTTSSALIVSVWSDARYGMVPNMIIFLVALLSASSAALDKKQGRDLSAMLHRAGPSDTQVISEEQTDALPHPVAKWLKTAGVTGKEKINTVWLRQRIRMKRKPGRKDWHEAEAEQYFTIGVPAFIWTVRMNLSPLIKITGRDTFIDGKGEMLIRMFSFIPVANEKGEKIDEGAIQRFLAEIVWFPPAALNAYIRWEAIDSLTAKATIKFGGTIGSGVFYFSPEGDFLEFRCLRYKDNTEGARRLEWIVTAKEHSVVNGIKIPTKAEVSWMLKSGKWTWLDLEITDIRYNNLNGIDTACF